MTRQQARAALEARSIPAVDADRLLAEAEHSTTASAPGITVCCYPISDTYSVEVV